MSRILLKEKKKFQIPGKFWGILAAMVVVFTIAFYWIMTQSGHVLVQNDEFNHVKWVAVLDGQTADLERNDFLSALLDNNMVDSVLILGRRVYRNKSNADFYAEDLMEKGSYNKDAIFLARHDDPSTITEAQTIIPWFKARNADTVLLLTSTAATHRVSRLFNTLAGGKPVFLTATVPYYLYNPDFWPASRESRKFWIQEWAALLNSYIDLWGAKEISAADSSYLYPIISLAESEKSEQTVDLQKLIPQVNQRLDSLQKEALGGQDSTAVADSSGR